MSPEHISCYETYALQRHENKVENRKHLVDDRRIEVFHLFAMIYFM